MAEVWKVAKRLLAGGCRAAGTAAFASILVACASSAEPRGVPSSTLEPADAPPREVTIVPLTPTSMPADVVRPRPPPTLEGELTSATSEPGRCPDPFPDGHPLHGSNTIRLPHADEVQPPEAVAYGIAPDVELEAMVRERLGDDADRFAVVIKDLSSDSGVSLNADRLFYAASLFKLEVMFEAFHQREQGLLDFSERYIASDYYASFGLGPNLIDQCQEVTVGRMLEAMMSVSDNVAAVMLQDRVGPRHINASMAALGLRATALFSDALPITAEDVALFLEAIARGDAVSTQASQAMADLLATEKLVDRIPAGVPDDTPVAHKTGNWENATHDAGIVYGARSTYVVVLLSDIGFDGDAASVQRDIMRMAWEWYEGSGDE